MDAEEFCLRWNNHHHVLVSVLDKLLEKESMCDVTLAADHQMIRVHRLVLCACSNYFEEMLSKQIDKQAFIFLKDVKFSDLKALVDYMYKGEVNVAQDQLSSFLQTAEALDVKGLTYKDDSNDQSSKAKSSHSNSRPTKRSNSEALSSNILTTSTVVQKPDNESSNQRSKPPPNKKALITPAIESHIPLNTIDADDNFLVVGQKFETDQNSADETMDGNGADWTQRDGEDDWSTSDPGLISIVPNSVTSTNLSQDNFGGPSVSETSIGDDSAGGAGPSGNRTSRGNNQTNVQSRGASPVEPPQINAPSVADEKDTSNDTMAAVAMDTSVDTMTAIATVLSAAASVPSTVCPRCSARFSRVGAMLVHLRSNECGSLPKFTCPLPSCNFVTRHQRNIKRHVVRLHPEVDYH